MTPHCPALAKKSFRVNIDASAPWLLGEILNSVGSLEGMKCTPQKEVPRPRGAAGLLRVSLAGAPPPPRAKCHCSEADPAGAPRVLPAAAGVLTPSPQPARLPEIILLALSPKSSVSPAARTRRHSGRRHNITREGHVGRTCAASAEAGGVRRCPWGQGAGPHPPRGLVRLRRPRRLLRGSCSWGFLCLDSPRGLHL